MGKKVFIFVIVVAVLSAIFFIFLNKEEINQEIPNNYFAVFHGEPGDKTYETYIYKDGNDDNSGYEYINVTLLSTTKDGIVETQYKVTKRGKIKYSKEVYETAKKNNAYFYVTRPEDNNRYTIEDFENQILPNL